MSNTDITKPYIEPNTIARVVSSSRPYIKWAAWFAAMVSIAMMVGWVFNITEIKNIIPNTSPMKFNTALAFLCGCISFLSLQRKTTQPGKSKIVYGLAFLTMLIGLSTLGEYILGWNLHIDQLLVRDTTAWSFANPGRMAFVTSICFVLWGFSILTINSKISQYLLIGILILSTLALTGYLYDHDSLYDLPGFASISLLTSVNFFIVSLAGLLVNPHKGMMRTVVSIVASRENGGRLVRIFLPLTILLLLLFGWLTAQAMHLGHFDISNGLIVFIVLLILLITPIIFLHADKVNKAEQELKFHRFHDPLTGLFNQSYFHQEFSRMERGREFPVSVLIADVDNLKKINDQYGNAIGDMVLIQTAQTLTSIFRANDIVARLGDDEFAVLLPSTDRATAESLLLRVRQHIAESYKTNPLVSFNISIGVDTAQDSLLLPGALKNAGEHLYQDKVNRSGEVG